MPLPYSFIILSQKAPITFVLSSTIILSLRMFQNGIFLTKDYQRNGGFSAPAPSSWPWWHWIPFQELSTNAKNNDPHPSASGLSSMSIPYSPTHRAAAFSILPDLHLENTIQGSPNQSSIHLLFLPIKELSPPFIWERHPHFPLWAPTLLHSH